MAKKRMPKLEEHGVAAIRIVGDEHFVVCICGWESSSHKSETFARKEHDKHITSISK